MNAQWLCSGPEYLFYFILFFCVCGQSSKKIILVLHLVANSINGSFLSVFVIPVSFIHHLYRESRIIEFGFKFEFELDFELDFETSSWTSS